MSQPDDHTCPHYPLLPTTGYRRGCRCPRCTAGHTLDTWQRRRRIAERRRIRAEARRKAS